MHTPTIASDLDTLVQLNLDYIDSVKTSTDVWARRNGQWLAVAAHVTRK